MQLKGCLGRLDNVIADWLDPALQVLWARHLSSRWPSRSTQTLATAGTETHLKHPSVLRVRFDTIEPPGTGMIGQSNTFSFRCFFRHWNRSFHAEPHKWKTKTKRPGSRITWETGTGFASVGRERVS
jgi:hypothetical protein